MSDSGQSVRWWKRRSDGMILKSESEPGGVIFFPGCNEVLNERGDPLPQQDAPLATIGPQRARPASVAQIEAQAKQLPAATPEHPNGCPCDRCTWDHNAATPAAGAEEPTGETWYSDHELDTLLTKAGISGCGLRAFICEHIRLAFNKGKQFANARLTAELAEARNQIVDLEGDFDFHRLVAELDEARRELAEAKEKHERELFDCGGTNDAWALEVDKLKAELARKTDLIRMHNLGFNEQ